MKILMTEDQSNKLADFLNEKYAARVKSDSPMPRAAAPVDVEELCFRMQARLASDQMAERRLAVRTIVARADVLGKDVNIMLKCWPV